MDSIQNPRIEHGLTELLSRIVPNLADEDDAEADQRFDDAYDFAFDMLSNMEDSSVTPDVSHVASLIQKRASAENRNLEDLSRLHNLLERLIAQPVLNHKWRMLWFLYKLSQPDGASEANGEGGQVQPPVAPVKRASPVAEANDGNAFSEAFAKFGLPHLPQEAPDPARRYPVAELERARRPRNMGKVDRSPSPAPDPPAPCPSEPSLLRDLPFTLQGLSSQNLAFPSSTALKLPESLPVPLVSLLHALAEPSLLYRGLSEFVESSEGGLVGQSFRAALGQELRSYLGLVATLEGQIRRALATVNESQLRHDIGKAGVTLKRCVIWTREATMGLRLMSLMVERSKGEKGGALISLIHSFSLTHGDPYVGGFAERLLSHVTRPFYDMLRQWIYDGELADPFGEFFVSEQDTHAALDREGKGGATSVWEDKYNLNERMIPSIITDEFAKKVFLIGKTLNFIRYGCGDAAWVDQYSKEASKELRYGDTANLEQSIGDAYKTTMARLTDLMANKFRLFEHLEAFKKYILLGAGDFIAVLMESLSSNLDRPANTQYRHTLTAQFEHAVRNSNAQFDPPDVLSRLGARVLELSHSESGWDVFTLDYRIDAPVDVIVTPAGSKQYLKVFNFLWRVKRVEFALGSTWRRCMTGARGVLGSVSDKVGADWKKARCAVAEMIHFVNQLQYYILFEVIESSWHELQQALNRPESTLDDLIQAHAEYLTSITRKGLLGNKHTDFTGQLHGLLKTMLAYKDAVDGLYSFSVEEFTRRQDHAAKIETRTAAGRWGLTEKDGANALRSNASTPDTLVSGAAPGHKRKARSDASSPFPPLLAAGGSSSGGGGNEDVLPALRKQLVRVITDFRRRVNMLLGDLARQPDVDMRWLAMVMNFNDVYQPVKRKTHHSKKDKAKDKAGDAKEGK